ncbi:MAG: hypothetical protein KGI90_14530 [Burkholderiales bacterium]|nr:hypothetical protein [Burkholderiales bacterium]
MDPGTRIFGVGCIAFDTRKPDGTPRMPHMPRKRLSVRHLAVLEWQARTELREGMAMAHEDFLRRS